MEHKHLSITDSPANFFCILQSMYSEFDCDNCVLQGAVPASVTPTETASSKSGSAPSSIKGPPENQEYLQADKGVLVKANTFAIGFPEASLGILVRATPQGRIYRGSWHSSAVAIKVCCCC